MKSILLIISVLFAVNCLAQERIAEYGKIIGNAQYDSYVSKSGDRIRLGDTLTIGKPSGEFGFIYITQGGQRVVSGMAGKKVVITQIKSYGKQKSGFKLWVQFKGFGLVPVFIDYDNALEADEIINHHAKMTRDQAIAKLKEAKDLFDLKIMTETDYEALRKELTPIIVTGKQ